MLESHPLMTHHKKIPLTFCSQEDNLSMNYFVVIFFFNSIRFLFHSCFVLINLQLLVFIQMPKMSEKETIKVIKKCRAEIRLFSVFLRILKAPKPKRIENAEKE